MKRVLLVVALVLLAAGLSVVAYILLVGPRMYVQPHIRAYQATMPPTPAGATAVTAPTSPLPSAEEARTLANPLTATAANIARGKVYYQYYCVFCHGDRGDGTGPVGESYVPAPADLRSARVRAYSDGQLLRAMILGTGHAPVLEYTVPPEHRWYLVVYARRLSLQPPEP
jgi:cytochrome c553